MSIHHFHTVSAKETHELAQELIQTLEKHRVILLEGDLGSGKTTFTQGIAKALKIKSHLQSPTYNYLKTYKLPHHPLFSALHHFDLYRLPDKSSWITAAEIGLEDSIENPNNMVIVEWPNKLNTWPSNYLKLEFNITKNSHLIKCITPTLKA